MRFKIYGHHDDKTIRQMETCMTTGSAATGVLCADGHLGYAHPIGGVVGYTDHISISGVGFDIACGNMAVRLDTPYTEIAPWIDTILRDISRVVSFGIGRKNDERVEHELFQRDDLWRAGDVRDLKSMAQAQDGSSPEHPRIGCGVSEGKASGHAPQRPDLRRGRDPTGRNTCF